MPVPLCFSLSDRTKAMYVLYHFPRLPTLGNSPHVPAKVPDDSIIIFVDLLRAVLPLFFNDASGLFLSEFQKGNERGHPFDLAKLQRFFIFKLIM